MVSKRAANEQGNGSISSVKEPTSLNVQQTAENYTVEAHKLDRQFKYVLKLLQGKREKRKRRRWLESHQQSELILVRLSPVLGYFNTERYVIYYFTFQYYRKVTGGYGHVS